MRNEYIVTNQVRCNSCGDTPFSASVHDFLYCNCGAIAVDGGQQYLRRVGDIHNYEDISIVMDKDAFMFAVETLKDTRKVLDQDDANLMMVNILHSLLMMNALTVDKWSDVQGQLLTYFYDDVMDAVHWALETGRNDHGIVNAVVRAVHKLGFLKEFN